MKTTMRQIVMEGPGKSRVMEVPVPQIGKGELLVRVTLSGICHSELYPWMTAKKGDTLGHESVGIVEKVGEGVEAFRPGDRVTGLGGGAFKEYIVMQAEKTVHVPDCLKDEDAISEPLACLLSAARKLPIETLGDPVAVVGCGYMGLGMISLFRAMGYGKITAIDKRPEALENALRFGATEVFTPDTIPEEYIMTFDTMGKVDLSRDGDNAPLFAMGCPTVMEFTGTQDGLQLAGDLVRAHGRLGIGGYHNDGPRSINYMLWNFKAITTINCHERRISYEARLCQRCIDLLAGGQWNFKGVTRVYDMEEFDRANEEMAAHTNNYIKGAIRCSTYGNGGF